MSDMRSRDLFHALAALVAAANADTVYGTQRTAGTLPAVRQAIGCTTDELAAAPVSDIMCALVEQAGVTGLELMAIAWERGATVAPKGEATVLRGCARDLRRALGIPAGQEG